MVETIQSLDVYQIRACGTAVYPREHALPYLMLKLASEAGEVGDKYAKYLRGDVDQLDYLALAKELGDVLWYVAVLAEELGYDLSEVANMNIAKLQDRAARGVLKGSGDNR